MARTLLPTGKVDRTGLRRWFREHHGYQPGWYTLSEAIHQGMPHELHPLTGRPIFDPIAVDAWLEARRQAPPQAPL